MRTQTTQQSGPDENEYTKTLNQFRGLVWSCHTLMESRWAFMSSKLLVHQMQEFKEKRNSDLLAARLFRTILSHLAESLSVIMYETWSRRHDPTRVSFEAIAVSADRASRAADRALVLLWEVHRYLDEVPSLVWLQHDKIREYQEHFNNEFHLSFKSILDQYGLTEQLEKLMAKWDKR